MGEPRDSKEELEVLATTLKNVRDTYIHTWTSAGVSKFIEAQQSTHEQNIRKLKGEIVTLQEKIDECGRREQTNNALEQEKSKRKDELKSLSQSHQMKLLQKESQASDIQKLQETIEKQRQMLDVKKSADEVSKLKTDELLQMLRWYEERLYLKFQRISGGNLQVIYTNIDPKFPNNPFYFIVAIDGLHYKVLECEPSVEDLAAHQQKLNETNNFRSFIIHMHRRFKNHVNKLAS